jgi:transcriptional regulator NrdR family protein
MSGMNCPECDTPRSRVMDSRFTEDNDIGMIRRRRYCENGHRYTTYESVDKPYILDMRKLGPKAQDAVWAVYRIFKMD